MACFMMSGWVSAARETVPAALSCVICAKYIIFIRTIFGKLILPINCRFNIPAAMKINISLFIVISLVLSAHFVSAATVSIQEKQLVVDNHPFIIKGVCYSPTPVGQSPQDGYNWWADSATYCNDFPLIKAMGANTIRTYDASGATREALDAAYANGLYVIVGYWVDPSLDLTNINVRTDLLRGFTAMVEEWKDHPAVLMWSFGNEVDYGFPGNKKFWYTLLNDAANAAHSLEGSSFHPVTTANQEIDEIGSLTLKSDDLSLAIDLWGINAYRGKSFGESFFSAIQSKTEKPFFLSEWGCDAFNGNTLQEDTGLQNANILRQWNEIAAHLAFYSSSSQGVGGTLFEWSDEWWKSIGNENNAHNSASDWSNGAYEDANMNEEWWGVVAISSDSLQRTFRPIYQSLQEQWQRCGTVSNIYRFPYSSNTIFQGTVTSYPNPFILGKESAKIEFVVSGSPQIDVVIYDLSGKKIAGLDVLRGADGLCTAVWQGKDDENTGVSAGIYIAKITAKTADKEEVKYRKIALIR
jgi:hypothetical protein